MLSDVSFSLAPGEAAAIMGPSGSGKSSLLYMLGALEPPTAGTVTLDGRNPFLLAPRELAAFRNASIGFVFQDHCLLPQCSVLENVLIPTLVAPASAERDDRRDARARAHRSGRAQRPHRSPAGRAVGRRTPARRDRARAHPAAAAAAVRRADRQSRSGVGRDRRVAPARPAPAPEHHPDRRDAQRSRSRRGFRSRFELRPIARVRCDGTSMTASRPRHVARSCYYWRTNLAVVLGVATAVAVLAGALLVGDSVRGSLRDLVLKRLGRTDQVVVSPGFFREALADEIAADGEFATAFAAIAPLIVVEGARQRSGERPARVARARVRRGRALLAASTACRAPAGIRHGPARRARQRRRWRPRSASTVGGAVLVRVAAAVGRAARVAARAKGRPRPHAAGHRPAIVGTGRAGRVLAAGRSRAACAPSSCRCAGCSTSSTSPGASTRCWSRRRRELRRPDVQQRRCCSRRSRRIVRRRRDARGSGSHAAADRAGQDARRRKRRRPARTAARRRPRERAARDDGQRAAQPSSPTSPTRCAATIAKCRTRSSPRSILERRARPGRVQATRRPPIVLNDWTARDLGARAGDPLTLEYYRVGRAGPPGHPVARISASPPSCRFRAPRPIATLAPVYPGHHRVAHARRLGSAVSDRPPPRPARSTRTTGTDTARRRRRSSRSRSGSGCGARATATVTSIRVSPTARRRRSRDARDRFADAAARRHRSAGGRLRRCATCAADGLAASRGATDFGEYFTYFSFFLVVSALLLAGALLQARRRAARARGRPAARRRVTRPRASAACSAAEGVVLAAIGSLIGIAGAIGYAALMMAGLRTWWVAPSARRALRLHVSPASLAAGAVGGMVAAAGLHLVDAARAVARVGAEPARGHAGRRRARRRPAARRSRSSLLGAAGFAAVGMALAACCSATGAIDKTGAFFGAGARCSSRALCLVAFMLRRPGRRPLAGRGWWSVSRLGCATRRRSSGPQRARRSR